MILDELQEYAARAIDRATDKATLEAVRVELLGRKGSITTRLQEIKNLPLDERASTGRQLNTLKSEVSAAIQARESELDDTDLTKALQKSIDPTLPALSRHRGGLHPITQTMQFIQQIFIGAGYEVVTGPEIEDDYHNFEALNLPPNHPARNMHDTFYLDNELLLRTHTSPAQIRTMKRVREPPIWIISPGRVYRFDSDRTHTPMFHQVEGLVIDKGITFTDLKGTILNFVSTFFDENIDVRFRTSYFPFTVPSVEVDIRRGGDWLEIMGCGMVHPRVLAMQDIDPIVYTGFAFGFGADRLTALKYGIEDLRDFFRNDLRFLQQLA